MGIPTIRDRVVQGAVKILLEPIFEAQFGHVSYGFLPGRNTHGALEYIRRAALLQKRDKDTRRDRLPYLACYNNGTLRRDQIALAINSSICRSQDQLRIHTSCIRRFVVAAIQKEAVGISCELLYMYDNIDGDFRKVKSMEPDDTQDFDIFFELPRSICPRQSRMAKLMLLVIAATLANCKNGF